MVLPQSGNPISLLNLQLEYDDTAPTSLSEFYGQANAPGSGTIDLADFYGAASTAAVTTNLLFELDARNNSSWSGSGTTWYDTTSNSYDFTLVNGPTGTTDAIDFDGTNDYAEIADGTWIPDGTSAWTCECYVNIDDWARGSFAANERLMFSKTSPSNQGMSVGFEEESNGNLSMSAATQGGGNISWSSEKYNMGSASSYTGTYFHAVWTYDGSVLKYYINGSLVRTSGSGKNFHANTAPLRLFSLDPSNGSYIFAIDGKFRVARMYSSALSASDVTTNYNNCTGGATATTTTLTATPSVHTGSAFTVTFTFDQNVGLFDTNDVTVSGGSKGTFTAVSKKVYTLVITPTTSSSTVTIAVSTQASVNAANLGNNAINSSITYSTFPTSNLYMDLDANDSSSYGGSGTTWSDLTSNNNDWTMQNGMSFVSSSPKHMSLDGSNDVAYRSFSVSSTSDTTWIIWHRPDNASQNSWSALLGFRYGGDTQILGFKNNNEYQYHWGSGQYSYNTGLTISANRWEMISLRVNSTSARWDQKYSSTSNNATNTTSHSAFNHSSADGYIGRDPESSGRIYAGDIARILVWRRRLTDAEVNSVYASTKGTFGY